MNIPVHRWLFAVSKITLSMKNVNCAVGDTKRCLPMGKPANCFTNEPAPEVSTEPREFKWCETVPGIWTPPAFGDDVLIKAGWVVRLGPDCLETEIVRHLDIYGSLIISTQGSEASDFESPDYPCCCRYGLFRSGN